MPLYGYARVSTRDQDLAAQDEVFLLLSGGEETGHKHDEKSDQPQHFGGNAGDHEYALR